MLPSRLIAAAALCSVALAGTSAGAATRGTLAAKARTPVASVRLVECTRGQADADRLAVFRGAMRRVPGTRQMWMRFKLQERVGDGRFRTVKTEGLGIWRKSLPGVRRFAHRQRVDGLAQGAAYRTVVSFRWYGEGGRVIRRLGRRSQPCRQPGRLPNLSVVRIGGGKPIAGAPGAVRYVVRVTNGGRVAAGRFGVSLAIDGGTVDTQSVAGLAPGERRALVFAGPVCQGTVTARADPEDAVREARESDNTRTSPCPA